MHKAAPQQKNPWSTPVNMINLVDLVDLTNLINMTNLTNLTNQAKEVAERHKLTLIDQIGDLEDHFLFEAPHVSKR